MKIQAGQTSASDRRALHYVFKIGERTNTMYFFTEILGMKILRHEEFEEGCKASCNGPYDGKWSKSMIGYGPEDSHFVMELTYNYGIGSYKQGNDFQGITIKSKRAIKSAKTKKWPITEEGGAYTVLAPGGYKFTLIDEDSDADPVQKLSLSSSNISQSTEYWHKLCGMNIYSKGEKSATLGFDEKQCKLELVDIGREVDHASAFGRVAFSCPRFQLPNMENTMIAHAQSILTPLVSLDTPGKATVEVVILADPDGHEICFVGDEAFRELSQVDPSAQEILSEALENDKSDEWFSKKGRAKVAA